MSNLQIQYRTETAGMIHRKTWRIGWDLQYGEFTLWDHYYFSLLQKVLETRGWEARPVVKSSDVDDVDVLVLNYPEVPFETSFIQYLMARVKTGLRIIALAYYQNEDGVAEILNPLVEPIGFRFNADGIIDPDTCEDDDPYMLKTSRVYRYEAGVDTVVLPCCCSIEVLSPGVTPVVESFPTAKRLMVSSESPASYVLAVEARYGDGRVIGIGTCVFWDNYSLNRADNRRFVANLLGPPEE